MGSRNSVLSGDDTTTVDHSVAAASSVWMLLPRDLLQYISARLVSEADRVHVGQVCRHWRSAVSDDRGVMGRPWILARPWWFRRSHGFLRLSHNHQSVGTFGVGGAAIPSSRHDVLGASIGWLTVRNRDRGIVVLMDPNSPAAGEIALPGDLPAGYRIKSVFLSGDPFAAPGWEAFAIAASADGRDDALASCRRGDTSWTLIDYDHHPFRRYRTLAFHKGRVFTVDDRQRRLVCVNGGGAITPMKLPEIWNAYDNGHLFSTSMPWLVECAGELLLVELHKLLLNIAMVRCYGAFRCLSRWQGSDGHLGLSLRVRKVVFTEDDDAPAMISVPVMDIAGHALFVGELGHAFAVKASGLTGVRSNFVYYVGDMAKRMVAFDLRTFHVLLHEIFLHLEHDADVAHFLAVCRQWRRAAVAAVKLGDGLLLKDLVSGDEVLLPSYPGYQLADVFLSDEPITVSGAWTAFAFMSAYQYVWPHERRVAFCCTGNCEWTFLDLDDVS
ncbi:hypothetical protein E2562_032878 [Oryza meyeriana var. granulata]|uniref:F-box domain-containing protein n=1 Tax=Oryza meyeriana var. granulata TaxID=110450 RepID=A0A6G1F0K3_9ORYZ|nr:hypothetical protein E2562_032878 [Oryza meyeriana var. granulata]